MDPHTSIRLGLTAMDDHFALRFCDRPHLPDGAAFSWTFQGMRHMLSSRDLIKPACLTDLVLGNFLCPVARKNLAN